MPYSLNCSPVREDLALQALVRGFKRRASRTWYVTTSALKRSALVASATRDFPKVLRAAEDPQRIACRASALIAIADVLHASGNCTTVSHLLVGLSDLLAYDYGYMVPFLATNRSQQ